MKQFQFRLQKVMETTRTREELKKRELAEAFARLTENESLLERMLAQLEEQIDNFGSCWKDGRMMVADLLNFSGYAENLIREIQLQESRIEELAEQVRVHREMLLEITRDKKVLEKLKDKRYAEFKKKLRVLEQKFMDELSVRSFHNGNGNSILQ